MQRSVPTLFLVSLLGLLPVLAGTPAEGGDFVLEGQADRALANYTKYCAACHGPEGKGDGPMGEYLDVQPKDLTRTEYMKERDDEELYLAIKEGGAAVGLSEKMAPWQHLLSDQEIRDLAAYVRTLAEDGSSETPQ